MFPLVNKQGLSFLRIITDFKFSYITTKAGAELDLIIERPGKPTVLVEIKSTSKTLPSHAKHLRGFKEDFDRPHCIVLSQDQIRKMDDSIIFTDWAHALDVIFDQV